MKALVGALVAGFLLIVSGILLFVCPVLAVLNLAVFFMASFGAMDCLKHSKWWLKN